MVVQLSGPDSVTIPVPNLPSFSLPSGEAIGWLALGIAFVVLASGLKKTRHQFKKRRVRRLHSRVQSLQGRLKKAQSRLTVHSGSTRGLVGGGRF